MAITTIDWLSTLNLGNDSPSRWVEHLNQLFAQHESDKLKISRSSTKAFEYASVTTSVVSDSDFAAIEQQIAKKLVELSATDVAQDVETQIEIVLKLIKIFSRDLARATVLRGNAVIQAVVKLLRDDERPQQVPKALVMACLQNLLVNNSTGSKTAFDNGIVAIASKQLTSSADTICMARCMIVLRLIFIQCENIDATSFTDLELIGSITSLVAFAVRAPVAQFRDWRNRMHMGCEALKLLATIGMMQEEHSTVNELLSNNLSFTQLGMITTEILLMPNTDPYMIDLKSQVIQLLVFMPPTFSHFLVINGAILPMVDVLEYAITQLLLNANLNSKGAMCASCIVLAEIVTANPNAMQLVSSKVFTTSVTGRDKPPNLKTPMHSKGSLQDLLTKGLLHSDVEVRQCVTELLFKLCAQDKSTLSKRLGAANAIGILQSRGIFAGQ